MVAITLAVIHLLIVVVVIGGGIAGLHMYLAFRLRAATEAQMTARVIAHERIEAASHMESVVEQALLAADINVATKKGALR